MQTKLALFIKIKAKARRVKIQGLSGTGKTELLLHKLKELYTNNSKPKIFVTCHNKILADSLSKKIPTFFNLMRVSGTDCLERTIMVY